MFGRRAAKQRSDLLPGGFAPGTTAPNLLFNSETLPQRIHQQDQVSQGVCAFTGPVIGGGPAGSPGLGFKMTREAIWMLNPDGSLYHEVPWSDVNRLEIHMSGSGGWRFRGTFFDHEFMVLRVEPSEGTAQALIDLCGDKGVEVQVIE